MGIKGCKFMFVSVCMCLMLSLDKKKNEATGKVFILAKREKIH